MKKILFPKHENLYKSALHVHSTFSDGRLTPEELKTAYQKKGFSIIAFTDHNFFVRHTYLNDDKFLTLNGLEIDCKLPKMVKNCHLCFIALSDKIERQPCFDRENDLSPKQKELYSHLLNYDSSLPDFKKEYSPECINEMIRIGREKGFFVTYNHPHWSGEYYEDYIAYKNLNAMEIFNYDANLQYEEYNPHVYNDFLRNGNRLYCIATDDAHHEFEIGHGFTVISAKSLSYDDVANSLTNGDFYASNGPEIKKIYIEDGILKVETSPAKQIWINTDNRTRSNNYSKEGGLVTSATLELTPNEKYFIITVMDEFGNHANSNAYFLDEI